MRFVWGKVNNNGYVFFKPEQYRTWFYPYLKRYGVEFSRGRYFIGISVYGERSYV